MKITINGKQVETTDTTLDQLIEHRGFDPDALIVELNLKIIPRKNWPETQLSKGDTLELLNFVGGG